MAGDRNQRNRHHFKGTQRASKAQRKMWKRQGRCTSCGTLLRTDPNHRCAGTIANPGE